MGSDVSMRRPHPEFENPGWAPDERCSDMNHFMACLVYCFFAEDTGIFTDVRLFIQNNGSLERAQHVPR